MSDAPQGGPDSDPRAGRDDLDRRRKAFDTGLQDARKRHEPPAPSARGNAIGTAFRIATEMLAALLVGGVIGWQLDRWLGTDPVLFLVFFALGAVAGMMNVFRYAYRMNREAQGLDDTARRDGDTDRRDRE